jgi:hypothetical protein
MHMELRKVIQAIQGSVLLLASALLCVPAMALWSELGSSSFAALLVPQLPQSASNAQQPGNSQKAQPEQQTAKTVVITGRIAKRGPNFTLKDSNGHIYRLDAADMAAPFEGKFVKVTGTLEASMKLLHVDEIEEVEG